MSEPEIGPNGLPVVPREPRPAATVAAPSAPPLPRRELGPALSAMALGFVSLFALGPITGVPAIVLGFVGLSRARPGRPDRTHAILGIVLGLLGSAWGTALILAFL